MANIHAKPSLPNGNGWKDRHNMAISQPRCERGESIGLMLSSWALYAKGYKHQYPDSSLADDYVLGTAWKDAGIAMRQLLNGEMGRLDGGTLDGFICDTLQEAGFAEKDYA